MLWSHDYEPKVQWTLGLVVLLCWLGFALAVREHVVRPLQTMANLLTALREGDFSVRARGANRDEALGDVLAEINMLGGVLQEQRLGALEATALLRTVMEEIDVAIFAFDANDTLRLVNRAGQELIAQPAERILGRDGRRARIADCLAGEGTRVLSRTFAGGAGRWGMRRTKFREGGLPHSLVVIADLSQPLREEELKAWQRLVRVIGHELNNSLAPIKSIAGSLDDHAQAPAARRRLGAGHARRPRDHRVALRGPEQVHAVLRAPRQAARPEQAALRTRPAAAPHRDARGPLLPSRWTRARPDRLDGRRPGRAGPDQPHQERRRGRARQPASPASPRAASASAGARPRRQIEIYVEDDGPGIANVQNLFVPFFTTKPSGSGIGLVLCRQIAENHGGSLTLENREDATSGV
jgi:two-component system nitrogen regulation sensor histidine kinase NtrY